MGYSVGINQLWLDEWEQMKKRLYSVSLTVKRDMQAQMDIPPAPCINIWTILLHSTTRLSCRDELKLVQECFYKDFSTNLSTKVNICLFKLTLIFVNHMLTSSCILWSVKFGFLFSFSFQMYVPTTFTLSSLTLAFYVYYIRRHGWTIRGHTF